MTKKKNTPWIESYSNKARRNLAFTFLASLCETISDHKPENQLLVPHTNKHAFANNDTAFDLLHEQSLKADIDLTASDLAADLEDLNEGIRRSLLKRIEEIDAWEPSIVATLGGSYTPTTIVCPSNGFAPDDYDQDMAITSPLCGPTFPALFCDVHTANYKIFCGNNRYLKLATLLIEPMVNPFAPATETVLVTAMGPTGPLEYTRTALVLDSDARLDSVASCELNTKLNDEYGIDIIWQANLAHGAIELCWQAAHAFATDDDPDDEDNHVKDCARRIESIFELLIQPTGGIAFELDDDVTSVAQILTDPDVLDRLHATMEAKLRKLDMLTRNQPKLERDLSVAKKDLAQAEQQLHQLEKDKDQALALADERIKSLESATPAAEANTDAALVPILKKRVADLECQLDTDEHLRQTVDTMSLPQTTSQALNLAANLWSNRLIVLNQAYTAADKFAAGDANEVFDHLQALACVLWPIIFEEKSTHPEKDFASRSSIDLTFKTGKAIKVTPAYYDDYHVEYKGRIENIYARTKGKNPRRGQALRIHFFIDNEDEKIVIAHCGDHLNNTMTRHVK